jgi:hypothetical protein
MMDARSILQIILDTQYFRNGHTDQASVPTAGDSSNTFHLPKDQGKSVRVCVIIPKTFLQTTVIHIKLRAAICQCHYLLYHHTLLNIT